MLTTGKPATELDDADLERELAHLHSTRHDTFMNGSNDAFQMHTDRMLALEAEYAGRFPDRTLPEPLRTREGSREMEGRPS